MARSVPGRSARQSTPSRDDVLQALREHVLGTVILEYERSDGSTESHVQGILVEGSRDPRTWETAEGIEEYLGTDVWRLPLASRNRMAGMDCGAAALARRLARESCGDLAPGSGRFTTKLDDGEETS